MCEIDGGICGDEGKRRVGEGDRIGGEDCEEGKSERMERGKIVGMDEGKGGVGEGEGV